MTRKETARWVDNPNQYRLGVGHGVLAAWVFNYVVNCVDGHEVFLLIRVSPEIKSPGMAETVTVDSTH